MKKDEPFPRLCEKYLVYEEEKIDSIDKAGAFIRTEKVYEYDDDDDVPVICPCCYKYKEYRNFLCK